MDLQISTVSGNGVSSNRAMNCIPRRTRRGSSQNAGPM
jgi:hypothetical protein